MGKHKKRNHCSQSGSSPHHLGGSKTVFMVNQVAEEQIKVNPLPSTSTALNTEINSTANPYPLETLYYLTNVYVSPTEAEAEKRRDEGEERDGDAEGGDEDDDMTPELKRLEEMKILMFVANDNLDLGDNMNVSLYISIRIRVSSKLRVNLTRPLRDLGFIIEDIPFNTWYNIAGITAETYRAIDQFDALVKSHIAALAGIFMVLIGKKLMTENYENWMEKRVVSFGRSCGIVSTDELMDLTPSQEVCLSVYR